MMMWSLLKVIGRNIMILVKNRLNAGFFSNLNAVLGWYWYSMRTETPIYVHWDGLYSENAFDKFFEQKHKYVQHDFEHNANVQHSLLFTDQIKEAYKEDIGETIFNKYDNGWFFCQGLVYTEEIFNHLRQLYNYVYTENLKLKTSLLNPLSIPKKTLGVNFRYIQFYYTNDGKRTPFKTIMSFEEYYKKYMEEIESVFERDNYEHIYLASSQKYFTDLCSEKFKDKFICNSMKRVGEYQSEYDRGVSLTEEYTKVLEDAINLTNCDHLLVSPSNLMFGVLYINPNISYDVVNFLKETHTD